MPSLIREKPKGSGRFYVNYVEEDGRESTVPLGEFGPLTAKKRAIVERLIRVGQLSPVKQQGRPRGRRRPQEDIPVPEGLDYVAFGDACDACYSWLEERVEAGALAKGTWKGRGYQFGKMKEEFGATSWKPLIKGYGAWVSAMEDNTRISYDAAVGVLVEYGTQSGSYIPDLRKLSPRTSKTPTLRRTLRTRRGESKKRPYRFPTAGRIVACSRHYEPEPYMALLVPVCSYSGFSPVDAHYLLAGCFTGDEGIVWDSDDGVVWYHFWRSKSEQSPDGGVPLPTALVQILRPFRSGERGIDVGLKMAGWEYDGVYPRAREHFRKIEKAAGVKPVPRHTLKRLRHTFQVGLENHVTVGTPARPVPYPVRKRLMGQNYEGGDAIGPYRDAEDHLCVQAVEGYAALLSGT